MMSKKAGVALAAPATLETRIYLVRGQRVMLDSDLAEVYGVETGALNRAVKRNLERFPDPFVFQLLENEWDALRCQIGSLDYGRGRHRKYLPYAFTEHGAVQLATVLKSRRAIQASIAVVNAFISLRHILDANQALARRIDELAAKVGDHDQAFALVFKELKRLTEGAAPEPPRERIGFKTNKERGVTARMRK
jgi:hypothetical protein